MQQQIQRDDNCINSVSPNNVQSNYVILHPGSGIILNYYCDPDSNTL